MRSSSYRFLLSLAISLHAYRAVCDAQPCFEELPNNAGSAAGPIDRRFDKTNEGDSFSCDLKIRASAAAEAIDRFRFGVLYDSERHIRAAVRFPLRATIQADLEVTEAPRRLRIRSFEDWLSFKRRYLSRFHLAMIACASLHTVKIVKSRSYGFMIGPGLFWFQSPVGDASVRVTAINLVPMDEASVLRACASESPER